MAFFIDYNLSGTIKIASADPNTVTIFSVVRSVLNDSDQPYRWSDMDLLGFFTAGEREIVKIKPNAFTAITTLQLAAGTKQTVPANVILILDVLRNLGLTGLVVGATVRKLDKAKLDAMLPGWHTATVNAVVKYFISDPQDQKHFYVFPTQPATPGYVEILASQIPPVITISTIYESTCNLSDVDVNALIDYMLYRAFAVDTQGANSSVRSASHYNAFLVGLGQKAAAEKKSYAKPAEAGQ